MMAAIRNIIFDLGGVILNVDYHKTSEAFKKLGAQHFDELYSQQNANELFEALETGHLTEQDFYEAMRQHCQPGTSIVQIKAAWNAILGDFRDESLQALEKLRKKYNLYLLSNTNSIHFTAFHEIFNRQTGLNNFDDYFIKAYYSHLIGLRKPYPGTYISVLNDAGIQAGETLFVDDSINNIKGAEEAGLQTLWLQPGQQIEKLIA